MFMPLTIRLQKHGTCDLMVRIKKVKFNELQRVEMSRGCVLIWTEFTVKKSYSFVIFHP
jgi:hypothetical protein